MRRTLLVLGFATLVASQAFLAVPDAQAAVLSDPAKEMPDTFVGQPLAQPNRPRSVAPTIEQMRGDPDIVIVDGVNYPIANSTDGSSINWLTGATCDCDTNPGFHFNPWSSGGNLSFWWWNGTDQRAGVSLDGTTYAVLGEGDTIGPASTFISAGFPAGTVNWRQASNVDGFLGFRFDNGGTVNYGYVRLTTTGTTGHPATIVSYAYNQVGDPITIPTGGPTDPEIEVSPSSFSFTVDAGDTDSDELTIENIGGGTLVWDIELEDTTSALRGSPHDPLLDETLEFDPFTIVSPANGGTPEVQIVQAGVLTSGRVIGFSFQGDVDGITGNSDWASDMCMQIEGPDGSTFSVGGIGAVIPNCNVNNWDFQGGGSTNDGTYSSEHLNVWPFPPGAEDDGDWTFTFIHGWNSTSAMPMNWSEVTVTLHKVGLPEPCDNPGLVDWLSVDPDAGSTNPGSPSLVNVTVDSDGLTPGTYNANLCVNSDDTVGNELVVVPVELTVVSTGDPEIRVEPASLSGTAEEGDSTTATLTIGNDGSAELFWEIEEAPEAHPRAHFPRVPYQVRSSGGSGSLLAQPVDLAWLEKVESDVVGLRNQHSRSAARGGGFAVPAYTTTGFSRNDYVTLDAEAPGALTSIVNPGPGTIFAQTFINDDFSQHFFIATGGGALAQNAYGFVDTTTGAVNQLGVLTGVPATGTWVSAAWDPSSGTVYAVIVPGGGNNQLFAIDVNAGTGTLVGTISGLVAGSIVIAIAIDGSGLMYGLEIIDDVLIAIDKTDATGSVIGPVGVNANFAQDMDFDRSTGTLYWASYLGGGNSNVRTIDTSTGATTVVGPIQDGAELLSFSIAISGGAAACENPANVPWLSVDADNGSIPVGGPDDEVEVTMDADGLSAGVYNARLCVLSNDPSNPIVEVPVEFTVTGEPVFESNLAVSLTGVPSTVDAGGEVSLIATVVNFGPDPADDVSLQVDLPAEFTFVSASLIEGSGPWDCAAAGQTVTCDYSSTLGIGFANVLQIDVSVDAGADSGTVETFAEVSSSNDDPNPSNNVASTTTTIVGPPPDLIFANGFECEPGFPDCPTGGQPGFYTDRDEFLANIQDGYYEEDFAGVPVGAAGPLLSFSGNGFSYDVTAVGAGSNNLFNDPGLVSTDSALDALRITFTGAPVTAIGGDFWATDISFAPTGGEIILELEDGTIESYSPSAPGSFGGFITTSPIVHITIDAPNVPANNWAAMDNAIVGEL